MISEDDILAHAEEMKSQPWWGLIVLECIEQGIHLQDCDEDGYCNFCGYQETI